MIAPIGQTAAHLPQPVHFFGLDSTEWMAQSPLYCGSLRLSAETGQFSTHNQQPEHFCASILGAGRASGGSFTHSFPVPSEIALTAHTLPQAPHSMQLFSSMLCLSFR